MAAPGVPARNAANATGTASATNNPARGRSQRGCAVAARWQPFRQCQSRRGPIPRVKCRRSCRRTPHPTRALPGGMSRPMLKPAERERVGSIAEHDERYAGVNRSLIMSRAPGFGASVRRRAGGRRTAASPQRAVVRRTGQMNASRHDACAAIWPPTTFPSAAPTGIAT